MLLTERFHALGEGLFFLLPLDLIGFKGFNMDLNMVS